MLRVLFTGLIPLPADWRFTALGVNAVSTTDSPATVAAAQPGRVRLGCACWHSAMRRALGIPSKVC